MLLAFTVADDAAAQQPAARASVLKPGPEWSASALPGGPLGVRSEPSRQRSTAIGVRIGAIAGAAAGAAGGVFLGFVARAVCESDCPESTALFVAETGLLGALAGAGAGALLGGIVGAAVPGSDADGEAAGGGARRIGRVAFVPAVAFPATGGGAGPAGSGGFTALFGRAGVGLELGLYDLGERRTVVYPPCLPPGGCADTVAVSDHAWSGGGVVRLAPLGGEGVRPYLVGGAAVYSWRTSESDDLTTSVELVGYSVGAGVHATLPVPGLGVGVEGRRHDHLSRSGQNRELAFYTVGIGATYSW